MLNYLNKYDEKRSKSVVWGKMNVSKKSNILGREHAWWKRTDNLNLPFGLRIKVFFLFSKLYLAGMLKEKFNIAISNPFFKRNLSVALKVPIATKKTRFVLETKNIDNAFFHLGEFNDALFSNFLEALDSRSKVIFDLGAELGAFSIFASKLTKSNTTIYAFEPDPGNMSELEKNILLNGCKNIQIVPKGISDESSHAKLYLYNPLAHSFYSTQKNQQHILVRTISLDDFIKSRNISTVDLIKINIEGAELKALQGESKLLKRTKKILLAIHKFIDPNLEKEVITLLKSNGFTCKKLLSTAQDHPWYLCVRNQLSTRDF